MKLLTIRFEESVDITQLPKGTPVNISDGTIVLNGTVMSLTDLEDPPEAELVPHIHPGVGTVDVNIGPAVATP